MKYKAQGPVSHVGPVETIGQKGFQKRTFVIQTEAGKWPKFLALELHKEAVENAPAMGDEITVEFWTESREWQGKWFTAAKCAGWTSKAAQPAPSPAPRAAPQAPSDAIGQDDDSQMPF